MYPLRWLTASTRSGSADARLRFLVDLPGQLLLSLAATTCRAAALSVAWHPVTVERPYDPRQMRMFTPRVTTHEYTERTTIQ
jgi:hypothetical protein